MSAETRGFHVPTQCATDALDAVGGHGLAIAGTAEDDAALAFAGATASGDGRIMSG